MKIDFKMTDVKVQESDSKGDSLVHKWAALPNTDWNGTYKYYRDGTRIMFHL